MDCDECICGRSAAAAQLNTKMSKIMENTQMKVKAAVDQLLDEVDKNKLRDMQKSMFLCSSKCCDDRRGSREGVERCIEVCNEPMKRAQQTLERELEALQSGLSNCAMGCYNKLVSQYGPDQSKYSQDEISSFQNKLDDCVVACADDQLRNMESMKKRIFKNI